MERGRERERLIYHFCTCSEDINNSLAIWKHIFERGCILRARVCAHAYDYKHPSAAVHEWRWRSEDTLGAGAPFHSVWGWSLLWTTECVVV